MASSMTDANRPPTSTDLPAAGPASSLSLFWAFTCIALQGFGGVMAVIQRELVERRGWLSNAEFMQDWAVAQVLPGPNVVNLSIMLGDRYFGLRGVLAAMAGMLLAPSLLVLTLGSLYLRWSSHPAVSGALHGMAAVAAGLVLGTGLKLASGLGQHPLPGWLCALLVLASLVLVGLLRWPLLGVLPLIGGLGYLLTWLRLPPC